MDAKKLNKEQLEAVEYGDGPVLIIAGAGTGKTTVITERIVNLVKSGKADPSEILALTFTEKATAEMQERVDVAMPYGYTDIWISTFHSFCDRVLREEALTIGFTTDYSLLSLSEAVQLLRTNLFNLKLDYFRPVGNPNKFIGGLLTHFSRLQDENITPRDYKKWLLAEAKRSGNSKEEKFEMKKWTELSNAYSSYQELKAKEGYMDFGDLIVKTIELFKKRPNVLSEYQKKFKYILIDEFQDTNYAQNELAMILSGRSANITVVGDDDQSIYRFRGAAISNIMHFRKHFPKSKVIVLNKNYRSYQGILDSAYSLIQFNNPDRLEVSEKVDKKLVSFRKGNAEIKIFHERTAESEADRVSEEISKLVSLGKYSYRDFAILVRANSHATPFVTSLSYKGIPHQFLGPDKLFEKQEIIELSSFLKIIIDKKDDPSYYQLISMKELEIDREDIAKILSYVRRTHTPLWMAVENNSDVGISDTTLEKLKNLVEIIKEVRRQMKEEPAGRLLYEFVEKSGILTNLLNPDTEESQRRALNIGSFFEKIKKYESAHPKASIFEVVDWIELVSDLGDSPRSAETDWSEENAVNILTLHSAKGLEFPVVFLVNLVHLRFPSTNRRDQIPIPESIIKETLPVGDSHLEEERRLFYVGMTRAKDKLFLTGASFYNEGGRAKKLSQFIFEALGENATKAETKGDNLSLLNFSSKINKAKEKEKKDFHIHYLSYSQIDAFKMCPLHYKLRYILNIPTAPSAALSIGSSVHNALLHFYEDVKRGEKMDKKLLFNKLKINWINEGFESRAHEEKSFDKASKMLEAFYKKGILGENIPEALESKFNIYLSKKGERPLRIGGKIDRVDVLSDNIIEIIDYKTGSRIPSQKEADNNLQLTFYTLAAVNNKEFPFGKKPEEIKLSLLYLEENKKITTTRTKADLENAVEEIFKIRKEIEESDFECSNHPFCENCEYKSFCRQ